MIKLIKNILIICIAVLLVTTCKKDKDVVNSTTIKGQVYNFCTDSGLANITVYLRENESNIAQINSGINGSFIFNNIAVHSSSNYSYDLFVDSKSGINGGGGTQVGIDGTTVSIDKNQTNQSFKLNIVPKYFLLCFKLPNGTPSISSPDSINIYYYQKKFHNNIPNLPWNGTIGNYAVNISDCGSNYPMGMWNFTINKWKSGVHTTTYDSLYMGYGATNTYTINW